MVWKCCAPLSRRAANAGEGAHAAGSQRGKRAWLQIDPLSRARLEAPPPAPVKSVLPQPAAPVLPPLEASEYEMVREALAAERGAIRRAAARLGMSHQSLLRRLKKWPHLRSETPWA